MHQSPDYERKRLSAWACQDVDVIYEKISKVGSGTYGEVNKARLRSDPSQYVALKKIKDQSGTQGFPITAMREINLLQQCNHPNVVKLLDVVTSNLPDPDSKKKKKKGSTSLVFEYMEHELLGLIQTNQFTSPQIKCIVKQILQGLDYIHSKDIIHRDIKSANILMNNKGEVKIADFGLARKLAPSFTGKFTQRVVTRWYRAPELLLGCKKYTSQIDIWALGCVFAELLMGKSHALFPAQKTPDQFALICEKCGVPSEGDWPGHKDLPNYPSMVPKKNFPRVIMQYMFKQNKNIDPLAIDLLEKMLTFNPEERINTKDALEHPYFCSSPFPLEPCEMPKFDKECHAYVLNIKRKARANINIDVNTNEANNVVNNKAKAAVPNQNASKSNIPYNEPIVLTKKPSEQPSSLRQTNPQPYSGTAANNSTTTGTYGALLAQTSEQPSNQIKLSQISNMTQLSDMNSYNSLLGFNNYGSMGMLDNLRQNGSMYNTYPNTYSGASNIDTNWSSFNEIGNMSNLSNQSNVSNMGTMNHTNSTGNMFGKPSDSLLNFSNNFNFMPDKLSLDYLNYQYCLLRNFSVLHFNKFEQEVLNPNIASFLDNKVTELNPCWPVIPQSRQNTQPIPEINSSEQKTKVRAKRGKQANVIRIPAEAINVINDDKVLGTLNELDFDFLNYSQNMDPGLNCKRTGAMLQDLDQLVKKRQLNNPLDVE